MIDGKQAGPFELSQLPEAGIRPSTYVWCKGMADWEKAEDVADICRFYRNHLYDVMHPGPKKTLTEEIMEATAGMPGARMRFGAPNATPLQSPTTFDRFLRDQPDKHIPTLEEIEQSETNEVPPTSMIGVAWFVTFLCCPPTGIAALVYAYKSREAWKAGEKKAAHDFNRSAKMWVGIFCGNVS